MPCTRAIAALLFSRPNSFVNKAVSSSTVLRGCNRSVRVFDLSVSAFISTPAAVSSSCTSFGRKRPVASIDMTFRRATPPSAPFLPALSSTCIAAFVSSNDTPAAFAAIPHCSSATLIVGSSAEPACPAAMTFIICAILRLASIGSASDTPYWFIAVVSTSAAAFASPPIVLLNTAILSPIALRASGVLASSGESCESSSLYDSTLCAAEPPNVFAASRA